MKQSPQILQRKSALFSLWAILVFSLLLPGCRYLSSARTGDLRTEAQTVELGSASSAAVHINLGAGTLAVTGGADGLMDATFRYNVDAWQPHVESSTSGDQSILLVKQETSALPVGSTVVNEWDLHLNSGLPLALEIDAGTANSNLDLKDLNLVDLQVRTGVGATDIDLSSDMDHDLRAAVEGGVGALSVKLPQNMGVRVSANSVIGNLAQAGLFQDGSYYVNEAYGVAPHTLFLDVTTGVGGIELLSE